MTTQEKGAARRAQQEKERDTTLVEIAAVQKRLLDIKELLRIAKDEVRKFSGFVNPEPFLGMTNRQVAKLDKEQFELTERLGRLNARL